MPDASPIAAVTGSVIIALFVFVLVFSAVAALPVGHAVPVPTPGPPVVLNAHGAGR
jgi:hypothetical protein